MRLQKKDLVDQFSLIVLQEIKNHNDIVLANNSSMDSFRRDLKEMSIELERKLAKIQNEFWQKSLENDQTDTHIKNSMIAISRSINDSKALVNSQLESVKQAMKDRESYFLNIDDFREFEKKLEEWCAHVKVSFTNHQNYLQEIIKNSFEKMKEYVDSNIERLEREMFEEEKEKKKLDNALDLLALNFCGHTKEIEELKKRCLILEKHIENVYILMGRSPSGRAK